jgi:hypothetical protein
VPTCQIQSERQAPIRGREARVQGFGLGFCGAAKVDEKRGETRGRRVEGREALLDSPPQPPPKPLVSRGIEETLDLLVLRARSKLESAAAAAAAAAAPPREDWVRP